MISFNGNDILRLNDNFIRLVCKRLMQVVLYVSKKQFV